MIIGAGPAGLTAALELLTRANVRDKGNRIDIGGHRLFSKGDRVMNWWLGQSPRMVADESKVWLGVEYFCYE